MINKWLTRLNFKTIEIENYLNGVETDWDDIVYQTGLQQDYTVSLSNRKEDFSYYWSMGYADREGVKVGDRYRNLRTRLNLESKVTSFLTVGLNAQFATRLGGYLAADVEQREHNSPLPQMILIFLTVLIVCIRLEIIIQRIRSSITCIVTDVTFTMI